MFLKIAPRSIAKLISKNCVVSYQKNDFYNYIEIIR